MTTNTFNPPLGFTLNGTTLTASTTTYATQVTPRTINIVPVANGYSVTIGCQTFVFESLANLLYRIEEYYNNPSLIEEHFMQNKKLPVILSKKNKN